MVGKVVGIGTKAVLETEDQMSTVRCHELPSADHETALAAVVKFIDENDESWRVKAIVHRVVHGGEDLIDPIVVTAEAIERLEALAPLAPLHQPHNLAGIAASRLLAPEAIDIACFDTAFHARQHPLFRTYALPREFRDQGIRRYGFHGLSYEWIARVLAKDYPQLAAGKVVAAHLGNGASLCAMSGGRSIDTTMGMTALDGLPMGSRCGALDPGVVTYLGRIGYEAERIEALLYQESGLKGLSEVSNDVGTLLQSEAPSAHFALEYFVLKVAQFAAMMAVSMGGLDGLVFSAGIGENAATIREGIVERLSLLAPFETIVIPANEEKMMALHGRELLAKMACAG